MAGQLHPRDDLPRLVEIFESLDEALYARWGELLGEAIEPDELGAGDRAVIRVSLDSIVKLSLPVIRADVEAAFQAGSNVNQLLEAIVCAGHNEGASHGMSHGLQGLRLAILARKERGVDVPVDGEGLTPREREPMAPWPVPGVLPFHSPNPRYQQQVLKKYDPELFEASRKWAQACSRLRKELSRRMEELVLVANDVALVFPVPYLDRHMHGAFETGVTIKEMVETILYAATTVQGSHANNPVATIEGGFTSLHHGLVTLERVVQERNDHGLWAPLNKNSQRVGVPAIPV